MANARVGARERAEAMLKFAKEVPAGLANAIETAAAFHDLGKLDAKCQEALSQGRSARLPWDHIDAGVAHLSAEKNWMAAWLVRAHHSPGLPSKPEHFDCDGLGRRLRGRRREGSDHDSQISRTDAFLKDYLAAHESAAGKLNISQLSASHGLMMRLALSCLVDADHSDTARFDTGFDLPQPPARRWAKRLQRLDDYVERLPSSGNEERDRHRKAFYCACRNSTILDPMVACEGPVGIGKTTAIAAYLIQRAQTEGLRRLIVVAPYTNIITQTAVSLRKALTLPDERAHDVVAEHHHRADFENLEARELAVLWQAPVIVTTAVQFFETLASNLPAQLRKLHALPGSAVFIDEAHSALPAHLWSQNWMWLQELAERWTCRFVFASGSLARFWENKNIVKEPVRLPELLTPKLKTTILAAEQRRILYKSAGLFESASQLIEQVCSTPGPRLVIMNTVQSAAVVARAMRTAGHDTLHLSTALAPKDRMPILDQVRERLKETPTDWSLVATSCVEAGVDLSFRTAFRERFSTANLIQVGGRVNRHGELAEGVVYDFVIDRGAGVTKHPAARAPAAVLNSQLKAGLLSADVHDPAEIVTRAMAEEIREQGGLGHDTLSEAEGFRDYPAAAKNGRVIDADTQLVVIDQMLIDRLSRRERVQFRDLLAGSVQLWINRINLLRLEGLPSRPEIYFWPYAYDPAFLGCMAGILEQIDLDQSGIAIL